MVCLFCVLHLRGEKEHILTNNENNVRQFLWHYVCVVHSTCKDRQWHCTTHLCDGVCAIYGEGHYITFDEKRFNFNGNCEYTLIQVCVSLFGRIVSALKSVNFKHIKNIFLSHRTTVAILMAVAASEFSLRTFLVELKAPPAPRPSSSSWG